MKEFHEVSPRTSLAEEELKVLDLWRESDIFAKTLEKKSPKGNFVFIEGPPTANGRPGLHHAIARSFKDVVARYKTMRGYHVDRKAGWDTHGLPVEIEVEKNLGISGKQQIENIVEGDKFASIAKFNELARESVLQYTEEWERFSERIGFWLDFRNAYVTYHPEYIESLWWIIKKIHERGFLERGYKVLPYCPRCGTALSSHEVAQGYKDVTDNSIFVKFELVDSPGTFLLAWTTTPWTLPGNVALAINPELEYVAVESPGGELILAKERVESVIGKGAKIVREVPADELLGQSYKPLFEFVNLEEVSGKRGYFVVPAEFVTVNDGTGIVHTAVMYGEEDYQLGKKLDLPAVHTVEEDGRFNSLVKPWQNRLVKDADTEKAIVEYLAKRGLLYREEPHLHSYPFCWRCDTALIYYARRSWFVMMSRLREELIAGNATVNWVPEHIKDGRFGEWLREVKDWAFSRDRYWGTPLPIWVNVDDEDDIKVLGSFEELEKLSKEKAVVADNFNPHRPYIDEITLSIGGKTYHRTPEVVDVWFDSGSAPLAQWHYPFENKAKIDKGEAYPADYISEAIDQTRGWFYTLLAISTLLGIQPPYKNVVVIGHILDKFGKKMSKSKGNVVDPWTVAGETGIDPLRWFFFSVNDPGQYKNFDIEAVKEKLRKVFMTLWNSYSFFVTYARVDLYQPGERLEPINVLDKWLASRVSQTVKEVTRDLDNYNFLRATRLIELLIDDLSNWYIRRSRRRFWKSENDSDKIEAFNALYHALLDISKLISPFSPFVPEAIYQNLRTEADPESIHLTDWPAGEQIDERVLQDMKFARAMVEAGLNQREQAGIKIRQPLARMTIDANLSPEFTELIADEVNVKEIVVGDKVALDTALTPELLREGMMRELVRSIQNTRKTSGLQVTDHIRLLWHSDSPEVKLMMNEFEEVIAKEVLADECVGADRIEEGAKVQFNEKDTLIYEIHAIS